MTSDHSAKIKAAGRSGPAASVPDSELLDRFLRKRDEAAFELLVWRHGTMVFDVCRRVLPVAMDAEDAFQATFLTLSTKGGTYDGRGSLAGWLYRVAYRIAQKAKTRSYERIRRESYVATESPEAAAVPEEDVSRREMNSLIDSEIGDLPAKYRAVIVLCHLQGKTNREAAVELGCPVGTIVSRLSRAKARLRDRLISRGVVAGALALSLIESRSLSAAAVSPDLVFATAKLAYTAKAGGIAALPALGVKQLLAGPHWTTRRAKALPLAMLFLLLLAIAAAAVTAIGPVNRPSPGAYENSGNGPTREGGRRLPKPPLADPAGDLRKAP